MAKSCQKCARCWKTKATVCGRPRCSQLPWTIALPSYKLPSLSLRPSFRLGQVWVIEAALLMEEAIDKLSDLLNTQAASEVLKFSGSIVGDHNKVTLVELLIESSKGCTCLLAEGHAFQLRKSVFKVSANPSEHHNRAACALLRPARVLSGQPYPDRQGLHRQRQGSH